MELRKDPITRSWVITGDDVVEPRHARKPAGFAERPAESAQVVANLPGLDGSAWSARSVVHPHALYHIEGEPARRGDGLYDRMGSVGAHEVLLENPRHDGHLWNASDAEVEQFLRLAAQRIQDLKRDQPAQVHQHLQEPRFRRGAGVRTSDVAADRDHVCAAPGALRTARWARLFRE